MLHGGARDEISWRPRTASEQPIPHNGRVFSRKWNKTRYWTVFYQSPYSLGGFPCDSTSRGFFIRGLGGATFSSFTSKRQPVP